MSSNTTSITINHERKESKDSEERPFAWVCEIRLERPDTNGYCNTPIVTKLSIANDYTVNQKMHSVYLAQTDENKRYELRNVFQIEEGMPFKRHGYDEGIIHKRDLFYSESIISMIEGYIEKYESWQDSQENRELIMVCHLAILELKHIMKPVDTQ